MGSILAAAITGMLTLLGVLVSNSRSRAVMEVKFEELTAEVEKHNHILERTYQFEADMAVTRNDIEALYREVVNLNPPQIR